MTTSALYSIPAVAPQLPALSIARTGTQVTLSWDTAASGYTLESTTDLVGGTWTPVAGVANNSVQVDPSGNAFYRLRR